MTNTTKAVTVTENLWDRFMASGAIADYIIYKKTSRQSGDGDADDIKRTCASGKKPRRQR